MTKLISDILNSPPSEGQGEASASAWYEKIVIPTYGIGKPEKNPMFLEKRVYQGSSGVVYPHPVIEKILDEKVDQEWNAVFLENQYLKIMILPELGGRVQMAYDKTKQRHFIYYNQVIKPALVGLTGPWISGGLEFNWPQHHRPSTYEAVDHCIEENADGSVTVWCSEVERMFRTRGMAGFTLHPDKAYLEIKVKLFNRTDFPQTFLWWANPAVKVNDDYQSVFPPDVNAVFDHGKRDVSEFPIAKGTYYKVDYSPGTDISRYKNIPVPTSYMAVNSKYNFVGGYENDSKGGLLHVANHHVSPGKKQWTWGHGDFGRAWDRNLTDEDGPYIELMCGVYTDNQPDFSWIMPGEEKTFSQYFMPYRDLGVVKNATKEAIVNLGIDDGKAIIKAYATGVYPGSRVILKRGTEVLLEDSFDFHPATSYEKTILLNKTIANENLTGSIDQKPTLSEGVGGGFYISIISSGGNILVDWKPESGEQKPIPEAAKPALLPGEIESNEQLYLTGLHLEQYRHATYDPRDYYLEALRRDPKDSRCNNAIGLWFLRRGQFQKAESYFRKAIETLTQRNPNPIDGEPLFNLGLTLRFLGKDDEAFDAFYKSVWNAAWMDSGYFQLARIAAKKHNWDEALELIDRSLIRNWHNHKARQLKVSILRKLGKTIKADKLIRESLLLDKFNFGVLFESCLLNPDRFSKPVRIEELTQLLRANIHTYLEFALDFAFAGLFDEAIELISIGISEQKDQTVYPIALYYKAWFEAQNSDHTASEETLQEAAKACPDYCFPNQTEAVVVLEWAKQENPSDSKAPYYLGNFWYNARQYNEAVLNWELSAKLDDSFPTVHRNLALAYFNTQNRPQKALAELEKAFSLDDTDSRILMELDQLYKRLNFSPEERLQKLGQYPALVDFRDDLYLQHTTLLNQLGRFEEAYILICSRKFHPWEGGEGKVTGQYVFCLIGMAKKAILKGEYGKALEYLTQAQFYPDNLGEGKLTGAQENEVFYWLGCAFEGLKDSGKATEYWGKAATGLEEPSAAIFYNDQQPETIYYQGLALIKLGRKDQALKRFNKLINFGKKHLNDEFKLDYFAVSLPDLQIWDDNLTKRNKQNCRNLIELGELGLTKI
jgi:tetratricopeptide (TPR) repeat protein